MNTKVKLKSINFLKNAINQKMQKGSRYEKIRREKNETPRNIDKY